MSNQLCNHYLSLCLTSTTERSQYTCLLTITIIICIKLSVEWGIFSKIRFISRVSCAAEKSANKLLMTWMEYDWKANELRLKALAYTGSNFPIGIMTSNLKVKGTDLDLWSSVIKIYIRVSALH